MHVIRVTTDLTVPDIEEAKGFYAGYLGLDDRRVLIRAPVNCPWPHAGRC